MASRPLRAAGVGVVGAALIAYGVYGWNRYPHVDELVVLLTGPALCAIALLMAMSNPMRGRKRRTRVPGAALTVLGAGVYLAGRYELSHAFDPASVGLGVAVGLLVMIVGAVIGIRGVDI